MVNFPDNIFNYKEDSINKLNYTIYLWLNIQKIIYNPKIFYIYQISYKLKNITIRDYETNLNDGVYHDYYHYPCNTNIEIFDDEKYCFYSKKISLVSQHNLMMKDSFKLKRGSICIDRMKYDSIALYQILKIALKERNLKIINRTTKCWYKGEPIACRDFIISKKNESRRKIEIKFYIRCDYLCPFIIMPNDNLYTMNLYEYKFNKVFRTTKVKFIKKYNIGDKNNIQVMELISIP